MYGSKNILFMLPFPLLPRFKKSADLSKNYNFWPKMLLSFNAGQSEVSLFTTYLTSKKPNPCMVKKNNLTETSKYKKATKYSYSKVSVKTTIFEVVVANKYIFFFQ